MRAAGWTRVRFHGLELLRRGPPRPSWPSVGAEPRNKPGIMTRLAPPIARTATRILMEALEQHRDMRSDAPRLRAGSRCLLREELRIAPSPSPCRP